MSTFLVYQDTGTSCNYLTSYNATYQTARDGSNLSENAPGTAQLGQYKATNYYVYQGFSQFDTSPLPSAATVSAATLHTHYSFASASGDDAECYALDYGGTVTTADWTDCDSLASMNVLAAQTTPADGDWTSTSYFPGAINKAGYTRLMFCSGNARTGTAPTANNEYSTLQSNAYIVVTYTSTYQVVESEGNDVLGVQTGNNSLDGYFAPGTSAAAGDVHIAWWYTKDSTKTVSCSDFTTLFNNTDNGRLWVGYRTLTTGETSSTRWYWTSTYAGNSTTVWGGTTFNNQDTSTLEDATRQVGVDTSQNTPQVHAITTVTDGATAYAIYAASDDFGTAGTAPSGWSGAQQAQETGGTDACAGSCWKTTYTAGSSGSGTWTTDLSSDSVTYCTLAIRPASNGASGTAAITLTSATTCSASGTRDYSASGAPTLTGAITCSASGTVPPPAVSGSGTPTLTGALTCAAAGEQHHSASGTPSLTSLVTTSGAGKLTFAGSGTPSLTALVTAAASGSEAHEASGAVALTALTTSSASGAQEHSGSAAVSLTSLMSCAGEGSSGVQGVDGSGTPVLTSTLSASAAGTQLHEGSGAVALTSTLTCAASGAQTHTNRPTAGQPGVTSGADLEFHAARANGGLAPGVNSPLTTTWTDTSDSSNDGTLMTFAGTESSGWAGSGTTDDPYRLVFDGTSDYVDAGDLGTVEDKTFSFEVWVKFDGSAHKYLVSQAGTTDNNHFASVALVYSSGLYYPRLNYKDGTTLAITSGGTGVAPDNAYHHVVGTADGTTMRVYLDGTEYGTSATLPSGSAAVTNTTVGARVMSTTNYALCSVPLARIYPFALSAPEVTANYNSGTGWPVRLTSTVSCSATGTRDFSASGAVALTSLVTCSASGASGLNGTGAVALTGTLSAAGSGTETHIGTGAPTLTGVLSCAAEGSRDFAATGEVALTSALSSSAGGSQLHTGTGAVALTGVVSCSASGASGLNGTGAVALTGTVAASAAGEQHHHASGTPTLTSTISCSASGARDFSATGAPTLTSTVSSSASGAQESSGTSSSTLTGAVSCSAAGGTSTSGSSAVTLTGTLAASSAGAQVHSGTATPTLTGALTCAASGAQLHTGTGTPTLTGVLSCSATGAVGEVAYGSGDVTLTGALFASASATQAHEATGTPTLTGGVSCSASGERDFAATGSVSLTSTVTAAASGTVSVQGTAASTLTAVVSCAGSGASYFDVSGTGASTLTSVVSASASGWSGYSGTASVTLHPGTVGTHLKVWDGDEWVVVPATVYVT